MSLPMAGLKGVADTQSLSGLTVLLTREPKDNEDLATHIRRLGGAVVENPLLQIVQRPDALSRHVGRGTQATQATFRLWLSRFNAVLITSANALGALQDVFDRFPGRVSVPQCVVVGSRSAKEAQRLGLTTIHPPGVRTAEDLARYLSQDSPEGMPSLQQTSQAPTRLLWLRGGLADLAFKHTLEQAGRIVEDVVCYDTTLLSVSETVWETVRNRDTAVVFYSPSAVSAYVSSQVVRDKPAKTELQMVAIGPTTAKALMDAGCKRVVGAPLPRLEGVIEALLSISDLNKRERRDSHESK